MCSHGELELSQVSSGWNSMSKLHRKTREARGCGRKYPLFSRAAGPHHNTVYEEAIVGGDTLKGGLHQEGSEVPYLTTSKCVRLHSAHCT